MQRCGVARVKKRLFLRHLYLKCVILPRQARDKHRENSKKEWRFCRKEPRKCTVRAFTSIPVAAYFVVATMTTVGYGEHYPVTWQGRVAIGCCMMVSQPCHRLTQRCLTRSSSSSPSTAEILFLICFEFAPRVQVGIMVLALPMVIIGQVRAPPAPFSLLPVPFCSADRRIA